MKTIVHCSLDNSRVRFTTCGGVFVLDAIFALSKPSRPDEIWGTVEMENPLIDQYIEYHHLPKNPDIPTVESAGWEEIQILLFDCLIHNADRQSIKKGTG